MVLRKATDFALKALRTLTDVKVVTLVPRERPEKFVRVDQGAPMSIGAIGDKCLVIVQVYGPRTATGVDWVVDEVHRLRAELLHDVQRFDVNALGWDEVQGPHEFPDPDLNEVVRWQFSGYLFFTPDPLVG